MPFFKKVLQCFHFKFFLLFLSVSITTLCFAQQTVTGKVTDNNTTQGLAGINVVVKGTTRGTITDANGNFSIVASPGEVLEITAINYTPQEITVGTTTSLSNIVLASRNAQLNEVVVIGYGQRQRKDLTGAYGIVGEKEIGKSTYAAPELALQGRLAGVQVSTPGGNPNSRTSVRIRGVSTFTNSTTPGSNDPLFVIDGVPITEGGLGNPDAVVRDVRTPNNPLALINPNDIESITVLKDASAAAIYGVRAANGVVLITTKRGKGRPKIEFNASYGVQNAVEEGKRVLTTQEYVALYNEAYLNNPNRTSGGAIVPIGDVLGKEWDPSSSKYLGNSATYEWLPEYFNTNAPYWNVNAKLSGATENLNYYVSADVNKIEGTLKGAYQDRYSIATNITSRVSKVIEVGVLIRGVYAKSENGLGGTDQGFRAPPWQPIYGNGPAGLAPNQYVDSFGRNRSTVPGSAWDPNNVNTPVPYFSYVGGAQTNPAFLYGQQTRGNVFSVLQRDLGYNEYHNYRALGNAYLQITPLKGLRVKGTVYGDYTNDFNPALSAWNSWVYGASPTNPYSNYKRYDTTAVANITIRNRRDISYTTEVQATYNTVIGSKHALEVTGVANRQEWRWGMNSGGGILYTLDPNRYNVSNASNLHNEGGYRRNWEGTRILIGYAGRASYKFDDKLYVDLTVRRDGSSRFAPGKQWGTFPAVGVAWRLTNEKFMESANVGWLNDLKLRANWGKLGNELATYGWKYLAIVNPGITMPNYPTGSGNGDPLGSRNTGAYLPDFANSELSWEEITTSGVGFDAVLFKNSLNLTVEYYNRLTSGIIQQVASPFSAGIQNPIDLNIGEVVNKGIEISANYNTKIGVVNVGFTGNFTTVKNEVTELYNGVNVGGGDEGNIWEGYPINFIRGYKVGGVFQTQAEIDAWRAKYRDATAGQTTTPSVSPYSPGDMYFQDVARGVTTPGKFNMSPDSIINDNDRVYLGKTIPGFYYGFGGNASFKNIDFSFFFRGQGDVQRINDVKRSGESMNSTGINQLGTVLERWTPSNPSTTIPRAVFGDPRQHTRFSDRWVEDAGFMRLQNVELAYRFPATMLSKTNFIQGIRVYVMGTNLLTFTNYSGVDPESDYNPVAKQWVFGLNASF